MMSVSHQSTRDFIMAFSPSSSRSIRLAGILLAIFITLYYLLRPTVSQYNYHDVYQVAVSGKKGVFIQDASRTEVDGPYDNRSLATLCASKTWAPGMIFKCEPPKGGVGIVRNVFLNCVRYAIEAGGTFQHLSQ
jgi:hypothetical protein